jgi:uncharacterized protein YecE (DUF72 family)
LNFGSGYLETFNRYNKEKLRLGKAQTQKLSLGLPQWREKAWKGALYPKAMPESSWLGHYAQFFETVEVSSTFYAPVSRERILAWCEQVPAEFRFIPKWPELITHQKGLVGIDQELSVFLETLEAFDEKLGVSLVQLPPHFSRDFHRELYQFLLKIPHGLPLCLEFRHESWFEQEMLYPKLYDYLEKHSIGMAVSDTPRKEGVFHQSFPGRVNLVRYLSDGDRSHDQRRLIYWKEVLNGAGDFHLIVHQQNNDSLISMIDFFSQELANKIREELTESEDKQQSMF